MNDALAPPPAPPKVTFTEFNVRQESGRPHFIRLEDSVVKRLEKELKESGPAAAARFGLLLGSVDAGENCTIAVDDFEPTPRLEDRIRAWTPAKGSQQKIVGYYRTHARVNFGLDPGDFTLFERHFPKEPRLALLVKPPTQEAGTAMFFLGENGRLVFDRATVEFPFNLVELGAEEAPVAAPALVAVPAQPATPAVEPAGSAAKPVPRGGVGIFVKIAAAGVVVIASVFGLSELRVFDHPAADPAPEVAAASVPKTAVTAPAPEPEPVKQIKPAETKRQPPRAPAIEARKPAPVKPAVVAHNTAPTPVISRPATVPQTPAPAVAAPVQPRPASPVPAPVTPPAEERPRSIQPAATPPPAPAIAPKPVERIPVTPPRVIRQFAPILPDNVRRTISGEAVVRVKVNVDAAGKVTSAEPISSGLVSNAVANTAVNAVKKWQFEPARRGAEKVAGDIVLSFTFRK